MYQKLTYPEALEFIRSRMEKEKISMKQLSDITGANYQSIKNAMAYPEKEHYPKLIQKILLEFGYESEMVKSITYSIKKRG